MIQTRIHDFIIEEYKNYPEVHSVINKTFSSASEVRETIKLVKAWAKKNKYNIDDILEDLAEIKDDLKWSKSKHGKFVLHVANNYPKWEEEINQKYSIQDLMIRAHVEKYQLVVMGTTEKTLETERLLQDIQKLTGYETISHINKH